MTSSWRARRGGPAAQLEPGDVAITAEGGADVRGGVVPGLPTVAQVAHLLLALLGQARRLPVQLRLLALQEARRRRAARRSASCRPGWRLSSGPTAAGTIRAVHERFVRLPARDDEAGGEGAGAGQSLSRRRGRRGGETGRCNPRRRRSRFSWPPASRRPGCGRSWPRFCLGWAVAARVMSAPHEPKNQKRCRPRLSRGLRDGASNLAPNRGSAG